jgi:hypothetical protein
MYPLMLQPQRPFRVLRREHGRPVCARARTAAKLTSNVTPYIAEMPMLEAFTPQQHFVLLRF